MADKQSSVSKEEMMEAAKRAAAAKKAAAEKKAGTRAAAKADDDAPKKEKPVRAAKDEDEGDEAEETEAKKPAKRKLEKRISSEERKSVKGLRIWAIILWVLAVAAEVGAFFAFSFAMRNNAFINGLDLTRPEIQLLAGALVLDAVFCIVAAQLWKKSNRISPCLADSKLVRTLWHQLGVIMVLVCFLPIGIYLLIKTDKLDKKTRTILLAACLALFLGAGAASVDYHQPSEAEVQELQQEAIAVHGDGDVSWTRFGKSYHFDANCQALRNVNPDNLFSGSLDDAFAANRWDPCDFCAGGGEVSEDLEPAA